MQPFSFGPAVPIATLCVTAFAAVMLYLPHMTPKVDTTAPSKIESSEIDQLENTLEDMEMLNRSPGPCFTQLKMASFRKLQGVAVLLLAECLCAQPKAATVPARCDRARTWWTG